jgi:hypothetical protein
VSRNGYVKVDRAAIVCRSVNGWNIVDVSEGRIFWKVLHTDCDNDQRKTDFCMRADRFETTGDLLECTAWLLRNQPELIAGSNWHGLIGRVLADTREFAELLKDAKYQNKNVRRRNKYAEEKNGADTITAVLDRDE